MSNHLKNYPFNIIHLDSGEEIYTGDDDIIDRIFGSNEVQSGSKRTNQSTSNTRNSAAADGHNSPTSLDPFARSKKPSNHHHYRHRTDANKCVLHFLIKHSILLV